MTTTCFLLGILGVLGLGKLAEMWIFSIIWIQRHGTDLCERFHVALQKSKSEAKKVIRDSGYDPYRLSRLVWKLLSRAPQPLNSVMLGIFQAVYSWHFITISLCISTLLYSTGILAYISLCLSLALLITRVLHRGAARLVLGAADNVSLRELRETGDLFISTVARRIALRLISDLAAIGLSFSFLFMWLDQRNCSAFAPKSPLQWWEAIYFSVVTITTTGYGDIFPQSRWALLLVTVQMALTWTIIGILLFHYSMTVMELEEAEIVRDTPGVPPDTKTQEDLEEQAEEGDAP